MDEHASVGTFGYLAQRSAVCEARAQHLTDSSSRTVARQGSLDCPAPATHCQPCVCTECGAALPAPADGGWVLWAVTADGVACFCNDCRTRRGLPTAITSRLEPRDARRE